MRTRIAAGLATLTALVVVLAGSAVRPAGAQDKDKDKAKDAPGTPTHLYGHNVSVRPGGEQEWAKARKTGIEFFRDDTTKAIIAISDAGTIAVTKAPVGALGMDKSCKWLTAHDLSCRRSDEGDFTQKTKKFGVELFRDQASNALLYACESGSIALAPVPGGLVTDKGPKWHHALVAKVRSPDQESFDNAKKIGVEVFKDENTGGLVYITETGGVATAAAPPTVPDPKKLAAPKALYGFTLMVRAADEPAFNSAKTKKAGLEVFEDVNANVLFYISEAGFVATAPNTTKPAADVRGVTWKSAMALRARKSDEKDFEKAKKYGIEVFEDNRTGNLIFICETGSVAVLPK